MNDHSSFHVGLNTFVIKDGKLLLGKRKGNGEGMWGLPGGHMEHGELMAEGARRELKEETGLKADVSFINLTNGRGKVGPSHYLHVGFLAKNIQGEPRVIEPDKFYEWRWFDLKDLPVNMFTGHQKQIRAFLAGQTFAD